LMCCSRIGKCKSYYIGDR